MLIGIFIKDADFVDIIRNTLSLDEITPQKLADGLSVSVSTVKQWAEGKNLPAMSLRVPIHAKIVGILRDLNI